MRVCRRWEGKGRARDIVREAVGWKRGIGRNRERRTGRREVEWKREERRRRKTCVGVL